MDDHVGWLAVKNISKGWAQFSDGHARLEHRLTAGFKLYPLNGYALPALKFFDKRCPSMSPGSCPPSYA
jgi:hypothetical protein